jgi:hypothetical protein
MGFNIKTLILVLTPFLLGCLNDSQNYQKNILQDLTNEERKNFVFTKLKEGNYSLASKTAIDIDEEDNFYLLLQGLASFGVDSLRLANLKFEMLSTQDTSTCYAVIAKEFLELMSHNDVDVEFRKAYLTLLLNELEFENIERICELFNDTTSTYDVEVILD